MPFWDRGFALVAAQYAVTTVMLWAVVAVFRLALDAVDAHIIGGQPASSRTVLVGPATACRSIGSHRAFAHRSEHAVLGFVDVVAPAHPESLGHVALLPGIIDELRVETVLLCAAIDRATLHEVVDHAVTAGCHMFAVPPVFEVPGVSVVVVWKRGQALVELVGQTFEAQQFLVKRGMDVVGAALGLVLLSPLFAALAIVIRLDSKGAVFFTQRRAGGGAGRSGCSSCARCMTAPTASQKASTTSIIPATRVSSRPWRTRVSRAWAAGCAAGALTSCRSSGPC